METVRECVLLYRPPLYVWTSLGCGVARGSFTMEIIPLLGNGGGGDPLGCTNWDWACRLEGWRALWEPEDFWNTVEAFRGSESPNLNILRPSENETSCLTCCLTADPVAEYGVRNFLFKTFTGINKAAGQNTEVAPTQLNTLKDTRVAFSALQTLLLLWLIKLSECCLVQSCR